MNNQGATVVISHHIADNKLNQYEEWLNEIGPLCRSAIGFVDWQIIRPIPDLTFIYTVIIRFDTLTNLKNWMESTTRKMLIEKVKPILKTEDTYHINSGLDFLFAPKPAGSKPPAKWKQFLITWSAIYPLSMLIPLLIVPVLSQVKVNGNPLITSLLISGVIVFLMVYLVMPNYTKLIRKWLYT